MIMDEKKYNSDDLEQGYMLFLQDLAFFMGESFKEGEVIPHRLKESAQTIENLLHSDSDDIEELLASELKNIFIKKQQINIPLFIEHILNTTKNKREKISKKKSNEQSSSPSVNTSNTTQSLALSRQKNIPSGHNTPSINDSESSPLREEILKNIHKESIFEKPEFKFYFFLILAVVVVITIIIVKAKISAATPDKIAIFENSDTVNTSTVEESLNDSKLTFDKKFLNDSKQIIKENVEKNFRHYIDTVLGQDNLKADTSISSKIQNGYISFRDKKIQYALCESTANISIPSLNREEFSTYTSAYIISLSNNKLIQTQCVIHKIEKELVLQKACKDEILKKHKIEFTKKDLEKFNNQANGEIKNKNGNGKINKEKKNQSPEKKASNDNSNFEKESLDSLLDRALSFENSGNYLEAEKIYKYTSMSRANVYSFVRLGLIYLSDKGLVKDKEQAYHCFYNAAALDNTYAQWMLGKLYEQGIGTEKNIPLAINEYLRAANKNFIKAQVSLGDLYSKGDGVQKDLNKAAYWYDKAQALGDMDARIKLHRIMKDK